MPGSVAFVSVTERWKRADTARLFRAAVKRWVFLCCMHYPKEDTAFSTSHFVVCLFASPQKNGATYFTFYTRLVLLTVRVRKTCPGAELNRHISTTNPFPIRCVLRKSFSRVYNALGWRAFIRNRVSQSIKSAQIFISWTCSWQKFPNHNFNTPCNDTLHALLDLWSWVSCCEQVRDAMTKPENGILWRIAICRKTLGTVQIWVTWQP